MTRRTSRIGGFGSPNGRQLPAELINHVGRHLSDADLARVRATSVTHRNHTNPSFRARETLRTTRNQAESIFTEGANFANLFSAMQWSCYKSDFETRLSKNFGLRGMLSYIFEYFPVELRENPALYVTDNNFATVLMKLLKNLHVRFADEGKNYTCLDVEAAPAYILAMTEIARRRVRPIVNELRILLEQSMARIISEEEDIDNLDTDSLISRFALLRTLTAHFNIEFDKNVVSLVQSTLLKTGDVEVVENYGMSSQDVTNPLTVTLERMPGSWVDG